MALSRKPLKGMRQLSPEEKRVEEYITGRIRDAGRSYGFQEYEAPVLEPMELFAAKSGSELAVEQSYNFVDKGGRELIMRPELTPSLARMVAASGELIYPVRWMSFPVCYRYERPQRGRAREFMQFNLDILGNEELQAELDVFLVLRRIMKSLGATGDRYSIRYSSRRLATEVLGKLGLDGEETRQAYGVIDKRDKMQPEAWRNWAEGTILDPEKAKGIVRFASCSDLSDPWLRDLVGESSAFAEISTFDGMLGEAGITEASFEACVVRGLDYYTGIVFELMDTGGENRRAICGGGRYDDLVAMFGGQRISGVGFGLGLLTLQLFLETYGLVPEEISTRPPAEIFMAVYSPGERGFATRLAEDLRDCGVSVEMDLTGKNLSRQFKTANRKTIPFAAVIGPDEVSTGNITLKRMSTGEDIVCPAGEIPALIDGERG